MVILEKRDIQEIEKTVKSLLHASRDCYQNQNREVFRFDSRDGYYSEAFGILRCLTIIPIRPYTSSIAYHIGADNTPHLANIKYWFNQLQNDVLAFEAKYEDSKTAYKAFKKL